MHFQQFSGTINSISDFQVTTNDENRGCYQLFSVDDGFGNIVNFVIEPTTYFVDHAKVSVGDRAIGFYDANAPVPLIFPPQYRAIVMTKEHPYQNVNVDFFNSELISSDGSLQLNISSTTEIVLENGQSFNHNPINRYLIVIYGPTTRSIPAQTTPYRIIVMC